MQIGEYYDSDEKRLSSETLHSVSSSVYWIDERGVIARQPRKLSNASSPPRRRASFTDLVTASTKSRRQQPQPLLPVPT
jgi:hypothetical protein